MDQGALNHIVVRIMMHNFNVHRSLHMHAQQNYRVAPWSIVVIMHVVKRIPSVHGDGYIPALAVLENKYPDLKPNHIQAKSSSTKDASASF